MRPNPFFARTSWLLVSAVLLAGSVSAALEQESSRGEVTASTPLHLEGRLTVTAADALAYLSGGSPAGLDLGASGSAGTLHIWSWDRHRLDTGVWLHNGEHGFETREVPFSSLQSIRLRPGPDMAFTVSAPQHLGITHTGLASAVRAAEGHASADPNLRERTSHPSIPFSYHFTDALALTAPGQTHISSKGPLTLAFWDTQIELMTDHEPQVLRAGEWPVENIGTMPSANVTKKQVVWIELEEADVAFDWHSDLLALAPEARLHLDGLLRIGRASGEISSPNVQVRNEAVAIAGNLTLTVAKAAANDATPRPQNEPVLPFDQADWALQGQIRGVWVNGLVLSVAGPGSPSAVAAAWGLGSLVAGVAAWRYVVPMLVGRISADAALRSPTRARLYDIVRSQPGLGVERIARLSAITLSTAKYHLRILHAGGLITRLRDGKVFRYFENHGKWDADQRLVSLLAHPKTSLVATTIARTPGLDQARLSDITGLPQSTVSFHLLRLLRNGAVRTERHRGHNVNQYHPTQKLQGTMSRLQEASRGSSSTAVEARA